MERTIEIPEGVTVNVDGFKVEVIGPKGSLKKDFFSPLFKDSIRIEKENNIIKIISNSERKKILAELGTINSHIRNMIHGVTEGWSKKLKIVYVHFPMTIDIEGDKIVIKNFIGEKVPRIAKIVGDTKVEVKGDEITVSGIDKEAVGQTAANIEQATKVPARDRRIFTDGIFLMVD